jgi:Leucine-rich repeat (LRR) protein
VPSNKFRSKRLFQIIRNPLITKLEVKSKFPCELAIILTKISTLKILDLRNNSIDDAEAIALAQNTRLSILDLSNNKIGDAAAMEFGQNATPQS